MCRFLDEIGDAIGGIDRHHTDTVRFFDRNLYARDRTLRTFFHVIGQHPGIIHFVNMVARQYQYVFGVIVLHDIDILVHRIGSAAIPGFLGSALLRGQQFDVFVKF